MQKNQNGYLKYREQRWPQGMIVPVHLRSEGFHSFAAFPKILAIWRRKLAPRGLSSLHVQLWAVVPRHRDLFSHGSMLSSSHQDVFFCNASHLGPLCPSLPTPIRVLNGSGISSRIFLPLPRCLRICRVIHIFACNMDFQLHIGDVGNPQFTSSLIEATAMFTGPVSLWNPAAETNTPQAFGWPMVLRKIQWFSHLRQVWENSHCEWSQDQQRFGQIKQSNRDFPNEFIKIKHCSLTSGSSGISGHGAQLSGEVILKYQRGHSHLNQGSIGPFQTSNPKWSHLYNELILVELPCPSCVCIYCKSLQTLYR